MAKKAVIVGGGIIGLSAAYYLNEYGYDVTITDKTDLADSCSYGNLGMIVPSHFVPLAAPGMVSQGIKWMFDSRSPFYVKPSLNPRLINWGLKFIKSATAKNVEAAAVPLRDINLLSKKLYEDLSQQNGFDFALEKKGILMYFKTEKFAEEETHLAHRAVDLGLDVKVLNKEQVQALEPGFELDILGAVHYRCDAHLYPNKLIAQLIAHLKAAGVTFKMGSAVEKIVVKGDKISKVITGKAELEGDVFVIAGGSWLPDITRLAGIKVPLMPGKGYSFTLENPQQKLNIPAILCEARVAITPMDNRMRYGGTMEIGPVNDRINMKRVEGIVRSVPAYFKNINVAMPDEADVWYGFRPCTPDGLPYLGRAGRLENMIIAGGHAMSGLSLGPASGKIVADIAAGKSPDINIRAFDPNRFS
ncbi:MAG: FAD-dependent oxidoreductase [Chitinophagaceae bacterium]|nr:MAG: FAD-dependent oxidoreductase [Chitinophagaceae bacterium]